MPTPTSDDRHRRRARRSTGEEEEAQEEQADDQRHDRKQIREQPVAENEEPGDDQHRAGDPVAVEDAHEPEYDTGRGPLRIGFWTCRIPRAGQHVRRGSARSRSRFPEAHEDHPWGETAIKVRNKVFCFLGAGDPAGCGLTIGVKLPQSHPLALAQPHVSPMRYGLGKAGWVTGIFPADDLPPMPHAREAMARGVVPGGRATRLVDGASRILPGGIRPMLR